MILVIGNGFDLDLGQNTSYKSFASSKYWPFPEDTESELGKYINQSLYKHDWLDLESAIGEFSELEWADSGIHRTNRINDAHSSFELLCVSLSSYLSEVESQSINFKSFAARLLKQFLKIYYDDPVSDFAKIFTFNYTGIDRVVDQLGFMKAPPVWHVHGSLRENNIVLGCGDYSHSSPDYEFMRKSFQSQYNPPLFSTELFQDKKVVFFGLSFGDTDYAYFDQYFEELCQIPSGFNSEHPTRLYFVTKDEASRLNILHNLYERTGGKLSQLMTNNRVVFIRTNCEEDTFKQDNLLSEIIS